jgi:hypothetical protein
MRIAYPALPFAALLFACSGSVSGSSHPTADGGTFVPHAPSVHVASPPICSFGSDGGVGGTADQCDSPAGCPSGQSCICGYQIPGNASHKPNQCVPAGCVTDSDCGQGGYCSPSVPPMCGSGTFGYFCHTPDDQCDDDTDCARSGNGGYGGSCTWTGASWTCEQALCAG